jgi:hypothetical protein
MDRPGVSFSSFVHDLERLFRHGLGAAEVSGRDCSARRHRIDSSAWR